MEEKKKIEGFLDEVVAIMEEKGIQFQKTGNGADGLRTEVTEIGNYLWLRIIGKIFIPTICNQRPEQGIINIIDNLVQKIISEKFNLFTSGLVFHENGNRQKTARQTAETIVKAFDYYESLWKCLMAKEELISIVSDV